MTKTELVARLANDLSAADDADQGRRLVLVRQTGGWRLGYSAPSYAGAWEPGLIPNDWVVLDWLTAADGALVTWLDLAPGVGEAFAIRQLVFKAVRTTPAEVLVVIAEQPRELVE